MTLVAISRADTAGAAVDAAVDAATPVLDRAHLARMTYGDRSLERELLQLFDRQAEILLARMRDSDAAAVAALAHTLKGSAVGIGAVGVAEAAAAAECAAGLSQPECAAAIARLAAAVDRVRPEITTLLDS